MLLKITQKFAYFIILQENKSKHVFLNKNFSSKSDKLQKFQFKILHDAEILMQYLTDCQKKDSKSDTL